MGRKGGRCILTGDPIPFTHIRQEGQAGHMAFRLMAIVVEGKRGRLYLSPTAEHARIAGLAKPTWYPDAQLPDNPRDFKTPNYGFRSFGDLFTARQLVALTTFCDLVQEARDKVRMDAVAAGRPDDFQGLHSGGFAATAYADAVATLLACVLARAADYSSAFRKLARPKIVAHAIDAWQTSDSDGLPGPLPRPILLEKSSAGFADCTRCVDCQVRGNTSSRLARPRQTTLRHHSVERRKPPIGMH